WIPSTAGDGLRRAQIWGTSVLAGAVPVGMVGVRFAAEAHLDRGNRDLRRSYETLDRGRSRATIATCVAPTKPSIVAQAGRSSRLASLLRNPASSPSQRCRSDASRDRALNHALPNSNPFTDSAF